MARAFRRPVRGDMVAPGWQSLPEVNRLIGLAENLEVLLNSDVQTPGVFGVATAARAVLDQLEKMLQ
jgi:hypothetical protein